MNIFKVYIASLILTDKCFVPIHQEEPGTLTVYPVYQDFIKPKHSQQSEDFGYSTIPDVLGTISPHNPHEQQATVNMT